VSSYGVVPAAPWRRARSKLVSHAAASLLVKTVRAVGLDRGLSAAYPPTRPGSACSPAEAHGAERRSGRAQASRYSIWLRGPSAWSTACCSSVNPTSGSKTARCARLEGDKHDLETPCQADDEGW
jgi:hypothetical protein